MPAPYEQLLPLAFRTEADARSFLSPSIVAAYSAFRQARPTELAYRFERVRLGVAMSLMKLLADLGDHEESRRVMEVLHKALDAASIAAIDNTINKDAKVFERLYTNLYVNDEGEQLLQLFERTLDADTEALMDQVMQEAVALAQGLSFERDEDDEDE